MLIYTLFLMTVMTAMATLAVDYGHCQLVKTQMQRAADSAARGILQEYISDGSSYSTTYGSYLTANNYNPVDTAYSTAVTGSGSAPVYTGTNALPTVTVTWGWWNSTTASFVAGAGTPTAVQVTYARTAANGNAVPLSFPLLSGGAAVQDSCDITATATAVITTASSSTSTTVPGKANVWLSGMPSGSTASYDDTEANATPVQVSMTVVPGTVLSFSASGLTSNSGSTGNIGPNGNGSFSAHMSGAPGGGSGLQNGIQTATLPISSLIGVFLTNAQPSTVTPPATGRTYTSTTINTVGYADLQTQQPFYIGSGSNASSETQSFVVPPGATRLYLGIFDTYENNNNPGSLSVGITQQAKVTLMN
jgi:Flp pilus assembly protein TadG